MTQKRPITSLDDSGSKIVEEAKKELISKCRLAHIDEIYPHENIFEERSEGMLNYISSLRPWTIVPSILVCEKTSVIIDGHHRYYVLKNLGYEYLPISLIKYDSNKIVTHDVDDKKLNKKKIIMCGLKNDLLKPKSTMHHCLINNYIFPVILLSDLRAIKYET